MCALEVMQPSTTTVTEAFSIVKENYECNVCGRLPARPVWLPACGHSTVCEACCRLTRPKSCPLCDTPIRTPIKKLKVNKSLDVLLRVLFSTEYENRPHTDEIASEIECNQQIKELHLTVEQFSQELRRDYIERAASIVRLHYDEQPKAISVMAKCRCGLVCIPTPSRKRKRYFYGCPRWRPTLKLPVEAVHTDNTTADTTDNTDNTDTQPEGPCGFFKWLSAVQCTRIALEQID